MANTRINIWQIAYVQMQSLPVCIYANQAALNMVESTVDNLQNFNLDRILGGSNNLSLYSILPTILRQVTSEWKSDQVFLWCRLVV